MISTKSERIHKARLLFMTLVGSDRYAGSRKRPTTLPSGINYTNAEWGAIWQVANLFRWTKDIPITLIFELEEIENKYRDQLMLAKFGS
jgi:hypothetical protein